MKNSSKVFLSVQLFGYPACFTRSGKRMHFPTQKATALLLYLVTEAILHPGERVAKEKILDLFWPGMPQSSALQNLRQCIYQVRKELAGREGRTDCLLTDRNCISLAEDLQIDSDLKKMMLHSTDASQPLLIAWSYPFLENFAIPGATGFDEWIDEVRLKLRQLYIDKALQRIHQQTKRKQYDEAIALIRSLITLDPYDSHYQLLLYQTLAANNQYTPLNAAFREYKEKVRKELGASPDQQLTAYVNGLQYPVKHTPTASTTRVASVKRTDYPAPWLAATAALLVLGIFFWFFTQPPRQEVNHTVRIAILPFENQTSRPYLADGITDDLIVALSKGKAITVISRQSSSRYVHSGNNLAGFGKALKADFLVRGKVREAVPGEVHVNVQLINTRTENVSWGNRFTGNDRDIYHLHQDIAVQLFDELVPDQSYTRPVMPTANPGAYHHYLNGRYLFYLAHPDSMARATEEFERAIALDSDFKLAQAWLAWAYCSQVGSWGNQYTPELADSVYQQLAHIEQEQNLEGMYYRTLGWLHFWQLKQQKAIQYLKKAVSADPNLDFNLSALAMIQGINGDAEHAISNARLALERNPRFFWNYFVLGQAHWYNGNLEEAAEASNRALALFGKHAASLRTLVHVLIRQGKLAEAKKMIEGFPSYGLNNELTTDGLRGVLAAHKGHDSLALQLARKLEGYEAKGYKNLGCFTAEIYCALGRNDKALDLLEEGWLKKDIEMNWVPGNPFLAPLFNEPRYRALVNQVQPVALQSDASG